MACFCAMQGAEKAGAHSWLSSTTCGVPMSCSNALRETLVLPGASLPVLQVSCEISMCAVVMAGAFSVYKFSRLFLLRIRANETAAYSFVLLIHLFSRWYCLVQICSFFFLPVRLQAAFAASETPGVTLQHVSSLYSVQQSHHEHTSNFSDNLRAMLLF